MLNPNNGTKCDKSLSLSTAAVAKTTTEEASMPPQGDPLAKQSSTFDCSIYEEVLIGHQDLDEGKKFSPFKPFWIDGTIKNCGDEEPLPNSVSKRNQQDQVTELNMPEGVQIGKGRYGWMKKIADLHSLLKHDMEVLFMAAEFHPTRLKAMKTFFIVLALVMIAGTFCLVKMSFASNDSPREDLRDFVLYEKSRNNFGVQDIEDLDTDLFHTYARASCVEAETVDAAKNALFAGLHGIPDDVREDLVQMAIHEGISMTNSMQDSNADIEEEGKANSFMAFWSTAYDPYGKHRTYKTCAMVTGVTLMVAETVAEWIVTSEKYIIGSKPCECGYLTCDRCPILDTRIVKWPVLERRSLSLKKQKELRLWMVQQAIQSAEHLVLREPGTLDVESNKSWAIRPSITWTKRRNASLAYQVDEKDNTVSYDSGAEL